MVCKTGVPLSEGHEHWKDRRDFTMEIIRQIEKDEYREDPLAFNIGDSVKVHYRITEGTRDRTQIFDGTVIKKSGSGVGTTFTVRRLSYGVGVERTFPINSPRIEKLEVTRRGRVRRSKLHYLRERQGRSARVREKTDY